MDKSVHIIGSGFSALAASCYLAKQGYNVKVLEKNNTLGGRARQYKKDGFTFDLGPSWYWMPDVFERFFADFGKKPSDYYTLDKLSPGYEVYFGKNDSITISDRLEEIYDLFEKEERGSSKHLKSFLDSAKANYNTAIKDLVYKPGVSPLELVNTTTIARVTQFFSTIRKQVRKNIKNKKLIQILEFPVLFLGAKPSNTPAFYNFMNYADFGLGTWHPRGGMYKVIEGMVTLARSLGVHFELNANVEKILVDDQKKVKGLLVNGKQVDTNLVLSGADYHHTETLLDTNLRQYSESYWSKKTFAPSSLLFYVGFDKKIKNASHHTLFFDSDFDAHAEEIYDNPKWPTNPLFYANFTSMTDKTSAPEGKEAGFFLIPLAPGIKDTEELREAYFHKIMDRFEQLTNQEVKKHVLFNRSFCVKDFEKEYNSYKGNAYGMANTLLQTAFLRPKIKSSKVKNLYFTGQLTVPGPGVPPALISGKIASDLIIKNQQ
ncbi:phytoene dehydrogenase [Polaribacter reichenbachii]|uniref:Phytoene dehydrogenase n=1 Tax=Polaribacter reichenbachii TaxID=996801 RepID=A0A1B8U0F2_9FLAO|nr:phytoene desaturase family protein [Polaribacter reichenbachii]APZ47057.1 phytoene dehydrogenase [Polaribacter reichenbachii]AUC17698.1 phytoene dehydrogenase [Polaribacter reichenbachii]OBY65279.1 phytoene dehydrogenase [Polaribacter reichenbachii]